jgi:hypothetical protein
MKRFRFVVLMASGVALSWVAFAQQNPMRPGRWEVSAQMEMANAPVSLPPITNAQCITQEQLDDPNSAIPSGPQDANSDCKVSNYQADGKKVTWTMACSKPQPMTGSGELVFSSPDNYTGMVKISTPAGDMSMKMSGKRLGDCSP